MLSTHMQNDVEVTEEPSKSKIRCTIITLSLHSVFVDHESAEKIRKHARQLYPVFIERIL